MKKGKGLLLLVVGFLLGAIIFSIAPVKAAIEEFICYKADYKLIINGEEYNDPDLPLLNYKGYTIASVRKLFEAAGLDVSWDGELRQAEVNYTPKEEDEVGEVNEGTEIVDEETGTDNSGSTGNKDSTLNAPETNPTETTQFGDPDNIFLPPNDNDGGVIFPRDD